MDYSQRLDNQHLYLTDFPPSMINHRMIFFLFCRSKKKINYLIEFPQSIFDQGVTSSVLLAENGQQHLYHHHHHYHHIIEP